jgi:hypothetical protein
MRTAAPFGLLVLASSTSGFALPRGPMRAMPLGQRSASAMLLLGDRTIAFEELDRSRLLSALQGLVSRVQRWREAEWQLFGVRSPVQFSSRSLPGGTMLTYYERGTDGGKLEEAGTLIVELRGKSVVLRSSGGAKARKQEGIVYKLLLDELRNTDGMRLSFGFYPPTSDVGRLRSKLESACLYNKQGQYERF